MNIDELINYLNSQLLYQLYNPIVASTDRGYIGTRIKNGLLHINGSKCPKCNTAFYNRYDGNQFVDSRSEQVAHIYGRRNFTTVTHGGNLFHIGVEADLDKYNNYIYLCKDCHRKYDNEINYKKYLEMLKLKKDLVDNASERDKIYYFLDGVKDELNVLFSADVINQQNNFSISHKQMLIDKLEYNNISDIKKNQVIENIIKYYKHLDNYFSESDNNEILVRVRSMYRREKDNYNNKDGVLNYILSSLLTEFKYEISDSIVNAVISYLIMKCEVLENDNS